jgi:2-amino-4-hydroxy-6-hydroxymethyldihydropteridine diphosphokinase
LSKPRFVYAIAVGANQRASGLRTPRDTVGAAFAALDDGACDVFATSPIMETAPIGPARRRFVNATFLLVSRLDPPAMLNRLHAVEADFGRRRRGQRWRDRTLDLDIILWSGGSYAAPGLTIPHPEFRHRRFVLDPLETIAPRWRDPLTGLSVAQLAARARRAQPVRNPVDRTGSAD